MPLLGGIDRTKVGELVGDPKWGANLDLALAQALAAKGEFPAASDRLAAATKVLGSDGDAYQRRQMARATALLAAR